VPPELRRKDGEEGNAPTSTEVSEKTVQAAIENLKAIKACKSPKELLEYVRKPNEVRNELYDYYRRGRGELPIGDRLIVNDDMTISYDTNQRIVILYASNENSAPWWAVFEETDDGPKLDWKSFVRYSEQDVFEFLEQKTTEPKQFRVLAMIDDYFNYKFSSPDDYICVRLFDPEESFTFYGYVKKESELWPQIRAEVPPKRISVSVGPLTATEAGGVTKIDGVGRVEASLPGLSKPHSTLTIKVKFPNPPQGDNQVEITEIVARSWYVP